MHYDRPKSEDKDAKKRLKGLSANAVTEPKHQPEGMKGVSNKGGSRSDAAKKLMEASEE